jgi:hypothetical protein
MMIGERCAAMVLADAQRPAPTTAQATQGAPEPAAHRIKETQA